jgi:hypothetical protein
VAKKKKQTKKKKPAPARKRTAAKRLRKRAAAKRPNPPKVRRVSKTTNWIKAVAVRFVKRKGQPVQVEVRKPARRRRR